jgi:hypothetical protein
LRGISAKKGLAKGFRPSRYSHSGVPALFVGTPLRVLTFIVIGGFNLLDIPAGHLKGRAKVALEFGGTRRRFSFFRKKGKGSVDLSETAGAAA